VEELERLRTPLTPGERRLFDLLNGGLDAGWEIYIQPHLNGLRPDFVVLNRDVGVAVFEVKDGAASSYRGAAAGASVLDQVLRYTEELRQLYMPSLGKSIEDDPKALAVLSTILVFTNVGTAEARSLLPTRTGSKYIDVVGSDLLSRGDVLSVFPEAQRTASRYMSHRMADELRAWLVEPSVSSDQREPLTPQLSAKQREVVREQFGRVKERLIKGTAGAGKSLVLAARVARLAMEGKSGLVLCSNITLLHYLRDLAARELPAGSGRLLNERVVWLHFHLFCKRVIYAAGRGEQYQSLGWGDDNEEILETSLPALAAEAMREMTPSFDFIYVDEGQDFELGWWRALRPLRRSEGEMLLIADRGQDLYGRSKNWTDEFRRGGWFTLDANFRTPPALVPILSAFLTKYVPPEVRNLPDDVNAQTDLFPTILNWIQVDFDATVPTLVASIEDAHRDAVSVPAIADFTVLVQSNSRGLELLDAVYGKYKLHHTFAETSQRRRVLKNGFQRGDARMKATTFHSFRGFESRCLFIGIDHVRNDEDYLAVYTALSRLLRHPSGSRLTVVCADPALEAFGRTFPQFAHSAAGQSHVAAGAIH
jgi:hypothetical protein